MIVATRAVTGVAYGGVLVASALTIGSLLPARLQATGQALYQTVAFGLAAIVANLVGGLVRVGGAVPHVRPDGRVGPRGGGRGGGRIPRPRRRDGTARRVGDRHGARARARGAAGHVTAPVPWRVVRGPGGRERRSPDAGPGADGCEEESDERMAAFTRSVESDVVLALDDIDGSVAHVRGLRRAGLLTAQEEERVPPALGTSGRRCRPGRSPGTRRSRTST